MGYIFLLIATFFNASKGYYSKKVSTSINTLRDNLDISLFRNIICSVFALILLLIPGSTNLKISVTETVLCAVSGVSLAVFMSSWIFAIKSESYMLSSAFASSSFIVPSIIGIAFLGETFTLSKLISFITISAAIFFLLKFNTHLNGKISIKQFFMLITVLLSQGINQSVQKIYTENFPNKEAYYTFYSSVFTVLAILITMIFVKRPKNSEKSTVLKGRNLIYALLMALGLFGYTFFLTLASGAGIDAIILYPLTNALSLIALAVVASIFFGEKLNRDSVTGIILVFVALVVNNLS
ncbi:MAG: EamA family transporter [Clostridia bacterium]|nr:EamA family transporter [Clostridia bacterium]